MVSQEGLEQIVKGVFGLRLTYLSKDGDVRNHIKGRLDQNQNPLQVARSISVRGISFDVYEDDLDTFAGNLARLLGEGYEQEYKDRAADLRQRYQDNPEDRQHIWDHWNKPQFEGPIRDAVKQVLSYGEEVDVSGAFGESGPPVEPRPGPDGPRLLFKASREDSK